MLTKINFSGSKMNGTNFSETVLIDADFSNSSLERCNFSKSNLRDANFENADLSWSNLREAFFDRTNLRKANLLWAHLCASDLSNAHIENAKLDWSCLADSKLTVDQMALLEEEHTRVSRTEHDVARKIYETKSLEADTGTSPAGVKYSKDAPTDEDEVAGREAGYAAGLGRVKSRDIIEKSDETPYK